MRGSLRLVDGLESLIMALTEKIDDKHRRLDALVTHIAMNARTCITTLEDGIVEEGARIVLALPPRVAAQIKFQPELPEKALQAMNAVNTWMAGQAKAVAVYSTPFWRDAGLSGDGMSRRGPLAEIHDASPASGGPFALFGFVGIPLQLRSDEQKLCREIEAQLVRMFGSEAADPLALYIKDWAFDPLTATSADSAPQDTHPSYGLPSVLECLYDGKMIFAGTEVASQFGGYLEGALEAAEHAHLRLKRDSTPARAQSI